MKIEIKERIIAQFFSIPVFAIIGLVLDLIHSDPNSGFGWYTFWLGVAYPLVGVILCAIAPTLVLRTRSVVRDLVSVFIGTSLLGVALSLIGSWSSPEPNVMGILFAPQIGILFTLIFGLVAGLVEFLIRRRTRANLQRS